jgi:hypothetical protein
MKFDTAPRLTKLPFILGDIALLALAWFIAARHSNPISPLPLFVITGCVVAGIVVLMIPFVVNYSRDQEEAATSLRHELGEQFKRLIAASEHLQNSTNQLKTIEEIATKNVQAAEHLPYRLQERITEFNQQLAAVENKDKARLEQELAKLRDVEGERLAAVAGEIAKSLAGWTEFVTGVRQQLAAAADLQAKLAVALPDIEGRIAGLQAAMEAAAKAAESMRNTLPPPARVEPVLIEPALCPVEPVAAAPSPAVEDPAALPEPVTAPDWRAASESGPSGSEPLVATRLSRSAMILESPATPDSAPALAKGAPAVDLVSPVPEGIAPTAPPALPPAVVTATEPATAAPLSTLSSEVTPPPVESPVSGSPFASAGQPVAPAPSPQTSEPFASSKPRKPRAPRKPRTGSTPPVDPAADPGVGSTPPVEIPVARPPPAELIAEPVADEPPAPENFSQVPPEETKPVASPSADGRTRLTVVSYIGIGNKLHLRGEGAGLSATKGVPLQFVSIGRWRWETEDASGPVTCRIYKNDKLEAPIGPLTLAPGTEQEVSVTF